MYASFPHKLRVNGLKPIQIIEWNRGIWKAEPVTNTANSAWQYLLLSLRPEISIHIPDDSGACGPDWKGQNIPKSAQSYSLLRDTVLQQTHTNLKLD